MPRVRRYTDEQLLEAIADPSVATVAALCRRLGLVPRGGNYATLRRLADELGVQLPRAYGGADTPQRRPPSQVTETEIDQAVSASSSLAQSLRRLGVPVSQANTRWLQSMIATLSLPTGHFVGSRRVDGSREQSPILAAPLETLLKQDAPVATSHLRRRLLREGVLPACCSGCHRTTWRDRPIPLELDHINGDRHDNRLRNLRFLCPNCHALTPTYRGRNIAR